MIYGVEAQDQATSSVVGGGYIASAVHFDGSGLGGGPTYLSIASLAAGTDNGFYSFSFWVFGLLSGDNTNCTLWVTDPNGNYEPWLNVDLNNRVLLGLDGSLYFIHYESGIPAYPASSAWTHLIGSVDCNFSAGNKITVLYANDVLLTPFSSSDLGASFVKPINGLPFFFGDDTTHFKGVTLDIADVWIAPNVKLHDGTNTIPAGTRRQFINADLTPVDPVFFPTSAVLFTGNAASFPTNHGTGGSFTLTGSLTDAATHP